MKRVVIESPYAGDTERNIKYARECMADCLKRGEAPIASHLLYTQEGVLDDNIPEERELGINAGFEWSVKAEKAVFYVDYGYSKGMTEAQSVYRDTGTPMEERSLYANK